MSQSLFRIILLIGLGYGVYRLAPAAVLPVQDMLGDAAVDQGTILGKTTDYLNKILGKSSGEVSDLKEGESENIGDVVDELVIKTKDAVVEKVAEDMGSAKEGVQNIANEQFCKTILQTLEQDCGKFYCSE